MDKENHKDQHNKTQASQQSTEKDRSNENQKNSDFGTKNRGAQKSGGGYDHPPHGAEPYKNEEE